MKEKKPIRILRPVKGYPGIMVFAVARRELSWFTVARGTAKHELYLNGNRRADRLAAQVGTSRNKR